MSRLPRALTTLPLALLLLAVGCGGDDKGSSSEPSTSPSATSTSAAPSASASGSDSGDDAAIAAAINLKVDALGAGWTAAPAEPEEAALNQTVEAAVYTCLGATPTDPLGDDFPSEDLSADDDTDGATLSSSVDLYASADQAAEDFALITSEKAIGCFRTAFETGLKEELAGSGGTVSDVTLVRRDALETIPDSVALRISAKLTVQGQTITFVGDAVAFVRGRAGVTVTTTSTGQPVPEAIVARAVKAVAARAEAEAA